MINAVVTAAVLIINFILQTTVLQLIEIRGVIPDTMLIIIVSYSLLRGQNAGAGGRIFRRSALRYIFRKRSRILCFVRYAYRLFMRNSPQEFLQGELCASRNAFRHSQFCNGTCDICNGIFVERKLQCFLFPVQRYHTAGCLYRNSGYCRLQNTVQRK